MEKNDKNQNSILNMKNHLSILKIQFRRTFFVKDIFNNLIDFETIYF